MTNQLNDRRFLHKANLVRLLKQFLFRYVSHTHSSDVVTVEESSTLTVPHYVTNGGVFEEGRDMEPLEGERGRGRKEGEWLGGRHRRRESGEEQEEGKREREREGERGGGREGGGGERERYMYMQ